MSILKVQNLTKTYGKGETLVSAVNDVSFTVEKQEFIAILGASGSGKSTLLHMIGGVDTPTSGKVFINNNDIYSLNDETLSHLRRTEVSIIYQFYNLISTLNVKENITLPLDLDKQNVDEEYLNKIIKLLKLEDRLKHLPNELSGGEQQRVSIGRALITKPSIILADEPTGNLDSQNSHEILSIFKKMNENHITIVMVSHDPLIASYSSRLLYLKDGKIEKELFRGNKTQQEYFKEIVSINSKEMQKMLD